MDKTLLAIKALSDRNRLRILMALAAHHELCACQITEFLKVAGATASRHLAVMMNAGLLKNRKQGRWIYFRLNQKQTSLMPLVAWATSQARQSDRVQKDLKALRDILEIPCEDLSRNQRKGHACAPKNKEPHNGTKA